MNRSTRETCPLASPKTVHSQRVMFLAKEQLMAYWRTRVLSPRQANGWNLVQVTPVIRAFVTWSCRVDIEREARRGVPTRAQAPTSTTLHHPSLVDIRARGRNARVPRRREWKREEFRVAGRRARSETHGGLRRGRGGGGG